MVTVPTYDPAGTRETAPMRASPVNADMFGAAAGRALTQAGNSMSRVGQMFEAKDDEARQRREAANVMDAYGEASAQLREKLYGEAGVYTRKGKDATGSTGDASKATEDIFSSVVGKLGTIEEQDAFRKMWFRKSESTIDSASKHEFAQGEAFKQEAQTSALANLEEDILKGFYDPQYVDTQLDAVRAIIRANPAGLSEDGVKRLERETVSSLLTSVVQRANDEGGPDDALRVYEKYKAKISGVDRGKVEAVIGTAQRIREATTQADVISSDGAIYKLFEATKFAESGGQVDAVSEAGALGVMQVMPGTARDVARQLGLSEVAAMNDAQLKEWLTNEETGGYNSWRLGTHYMAQQLRAFDGDVEAALIAYNAGPKNAEKFLEAGRDYEALPKPEETYPYVGKVLSKFYGYPMPDARGEGSTGYQKALKSNAQFQYNGDAKSFLKGLLHSGKPSTYIDDLSPAMADRFAAMVDAAPPYVRNGLDILSGARSVERQRELWNDAVKKYGSPEAARKWVAPPGNSQHNHGNSIDLGWDGGKFSAAPKEVRDWVHTNASRFGLAFPMGWEPWHIETAEARDGTVARVGSSDASSSRVSDAHRDYKPGNLTISLNDSVGSAADIYMNQTSPFRVDPDGGNLDDWLETAREKYREDPQMLAEVERQLTTEWKQREAGRKEESEAMQREAFALLVRGGKVSDLPPTALEKLGPDSVSKLLTLEGKLAPGGDDKTDDATYYELTMMDAAEFADVNLIDYSDRLSGSDFRSLAQKQADIVRGGSAASSTDMTRTQIIGNAQDMLGLDPSNKPKDAEALATLNRALNGRIAAFLEENKKQPSGPEIQEMVDDLLLKGRVSKDWARDPERRVFELTPDEMDAFYVVESFDDIPQEQHATIAKGYNAVWGTNPGEDAAVDFYNDMVKVGLGAAPSPPEALSKMIAQGLAARLGRPATPEEIAMTYKRAIQKGME